MNTEARSEIVQGDSRCQPLNSPQQCPEMPLEEENDAHDAY